ncbi:MFS transporter [Chloroflexota bacterium]
MAEVSNIAEVVEQRSFLKIMTSRTFLMASVLFMFPIMTNQMLVVHTIPFAEGVGIGKTAAAAAVGLTGISGMAGTILFPALSSWFSWKLLVLITTLGTTLTIVWLMATSSLWMLTFFAVLYGFVFYGLNSTRLGLLRELFGTRWLASVISIQMAAGALFSATGPILGGYIYDHSGSYTIAFLVGVISMAVAVLVAIILKKRPD